MGRSKAGDENTRTLVKVGGDTSYAVTLPIEGIRKLRWQERQKVVVEIDEKNKRFIVRDWSA